MKRMIKKYRVSYDRPRHLSVEGRSALVRDEPGPVTLNHAKAMCIKWNVGASLREWNPESYYVGRLDYDGNLEEASENNRETRKFAENEERKRKEWRSRMGLR